MRAVIYARYSTDNQREASIDDQVRVCTARADREGWTVVEVYADYAISGATSDRPRFQELIKAGRAGLFDIVLAEALDRLSRDQEHIAGLYKALTFADIGLVTIAEGPVNELHVGLKGTMSAMFLKDLALKTHRGIEGRVRAGQSGGGLSFGYRVPRRARADGTPITGEMEIVSEEAAVIGRLFTDYASGVSPRSIAKSLNSEGVRGPRGGRWTASLILGNATRETGMLRNRLYSGERIWNRQRFLKDPATGRRVSRPNPRDAWVVTPVPALRLIDISLWSSVQARLAAGSRKVSDSDDAGTHAEESGRSMGGRIGRARRPTWLLAGLVRCGVCNGPMGVVANDGRLGCANRRERGTCANPRTLLRDRLLERVFTGLKQRLLAPDLVEAFVQEYVTEVNAANRTRGKTLAKLSQDSARNSRQISNLMEMLKEGHRSQAVVQELRGLEDRQASLSAQMTAAGKPEPVPTLHPNLPDLYRRKVEALEKALQDPSAAALAAEALRTLIDAILVHPYPHGEGRLLGLRQVGDLSGARTIAVKIRGRLDGDLHRR